MTKLSFVVVVVASQNPSMLTMALRRVARPDEVSFMLLSCVFSALLA